jgi:hypothetical protein
MDVPHVTILHQAPSDCHSRVLFSVPSLCCLHRDFQSLDIPDFHWLKAGVDVRGEIGVGGTTVFTSLAILAIWLLCGLLVRISFVSAFSRALERTISGLIPGYSTYRAIAEEKVANKAKLLPYASALLNQGDCQQPAFVIDKDDEGNFVLFLPEIPETNHGRVVVAHRDKVRLVPSLSANELNVLLKNLGKGLLSERAINRKVA